MVIFHLTNSSSFHYIHSFAFFYFLLCCSLYQLNDNLNNFQLSFFLKYTFKIIQSCLDNLLSISHKTWYEMFNLYFSSKYFLVFITIFG